MEPFLAPHFFDLNGFEHVRLFPDQAPVWEALGRAFDEYLSAWTCWEIRSPIPAGVHIDGGPIFVGADCRIEPGAFLRGPLIVGPKSEIRTGAYLRGHVVLGRNCLVGAHSELKNAILLDHARAPHQNYVGDSILGRHVNLGAGTILSNVKNVGSEVSFHHQGTLIRTGLRKLGAVLGDGCRTGCNSVLNPGVLMGPKCVTYPGACLRSGYFPPGTLVKLRQVQQLVQLDKLPTP
jgi:NDP-sugar pyrophosphorylase family protein